MLTNTQKADKLREAIALLDEVDALMQEALGADDLCYDLHCGIEDIAETLQGEMTVLEKADV